MVRLKKKPQRGAPRKTPQTHATAPAAAQGGAGAGGSKRQALGVAQGGVKKKGRKTQVTATAPRKLLAAKGAKRQHRFRPRDRRTS